MRPASINVLVPFWGLVGGVIKILDYAEHCALLGISTTVWAPPLPADGDLAYSLPVMQRLRSNDLVTIRDLDELDLDADSTVLFTEPTHYDLIERAAPESLGSNLIHLVQNTRHGNPQWLDGRNYRLLHRPMTRIAVTTFVADAVSAIVNTRFPTHTIVGGHDTDYFHRPDKPELPTGAPLRVLYMTWKSDLGDRVAELLSHDDRFAFIAVRTPLGWPSLRNRYHGADVLLCAPGPQEGWYLPGLEAMSAKVAVVSALVGGNEVYISEGHNALVALFESAPEHAAALCRLADESGLLDQLVRNGNEMAANHTLERERGEFSDVLDAISN